MDIDKITDILRRFRDDREGWPAKHTLRNLVMALNVEAAELLKLLQWEHDHQIEGWLATSDHRQQTAYEVADVFIYLAYIVDYLEIDLESAVLSKIDINNDRFPKTKGVSSASAGQGDDQ